MKILAILLMLLFVPLGAQAEWSVAAGVDTVVPREPMVELRYFGETWKHWSAYISSNNVVGGEFYLHPGLFELGIGLEYARPTEIVDTPLAYQLRLEYRINEALGIGIRHRSNCKEICDVRCLRPFRIGSDDSLNNGYNFLYLRYRF